MKPIGRIAVDPIACDGHGLCAELFPDRIVLDDWGYPIVDPTNVPPALARHAQRAVAQCPTRALRVVASKEPPPRTARHSR